MALQTRVLDGYGVQALQTRVLDRWSKDRTYCIGADVQPWELLDEVKLLDRQKYRSVEDAVTALNKGQVFLSEGANFCIVYSLRRQAYYLLWPYGKSDADVAELAALVKNPAKSSTSTVQVSRVSVSSMKMSSALQAYTQARAADISIGSALTPAAEINSLTSTTDTTPEQQTTPDRCSRELKTTSTGRRILSKPSSDVPLTPRSPSGGEVSAVASSLPTSLKKGYPRPLPATSATSPTVPLQNPRSFPVANPRSDSPIMSRGSSKEQPKVVASVKLMRPSVLSSTPVPTPQLSTTPAASQQLAATPAKLPTTPAKVASSPVKMGATTPTKAQATSSSPTKATVYAATSDAIANVAPATESSSVDLVGIAFSDVKHLSVEELRLPSSVFDPSNPRMRSLLLEKLNFANDADITPMEDNSGVFNDGVWNISDKRTQGLVMKLVGHEACHGLVVNTGRHVLRATDSEKFIKLHDQCPNIVSEFSLSFPVKIYQLRGPSGIRCKDLIVMRKASGMQLTRILYHKWHAKELTELLQIFKEFGIFISTIHRVYRGRQHGDCQPSNVFYDSLNGFFTLIDVADFGYGPFITDGGENDVEYFVKGLKTLSKWYGVSFIADAERHFRQGYRDEKLRKK